MIVLGISRAAIAGEDLDNIVYFEEGSSYFDLETGNRLLGARDNDDSIYSPDYELTELEKFMVESGGGLRLTNAAAVNSEAGAGLAYEPGPGGMVNFSLGPQEAIPASGVVSPFNPPPPQPPE